MAALDATLDTGLIAIPAAEPATGKTRRRAGTLFWVALAWIGLVIAAAAIADLLPIPSPTDIDMLGRRAGPSAEHWLGTDGLGRDEFSRLLFGARVSLGVGLLAPIIGLLFGGTLGMLAGYFRGRFETLVAGSVDVVLAFPPLVLAMAVTAYLGQSIPNLILVLGFLGIPAFTRVARAATLSLSQREFVTAARAIGASHARILLRELLPNVALAADGVLPARRRRHHRRRGRPQLPRPRRAPARAQLGHHDRRRPRKPGCRADARVSCRPSPCS